MTMSVAFYDALNDCLVDRDSLDVDVQGIREAGIVLATMFRSKRGKGFPSPIWVAWQKDYKGVFTLDDEEVPTFILDRIYSLVETS